jgi:ribosomal protein S18 acetylase RimI-like enzyme
MIIRNYESSDKNSVISLWEVVFNPKKPYNNPEIVINMKIKENDDLFFVAEENNNVIGTIIAGFDGHRGWLYSLAVLPQYQRKGVGSLLVNKAITELKKLGCMKVNLQINVDNREVVTFYKKMSFHIEDRISMGRVLEN